ncbi:MAG TPA: hypothetical protein VHD62_15800 [Opitutaceae bacterium]|nr:hypothetical protein [Opitutaceae bacterium]
MTPRPLRVLMAPDWRPNNPYLRLLSAALAAQGVEVAFPTGTKRALPLARLVAQQPCDWLHLHWPEAFWSRGSGLALRLRQWRFPLDLALANRRARIAYTAHNLTPHDAPAGRLVRRNLRLLLRRASVVFVHSAAAQRAVETTHGPLGDRAAIEPHGDLLPVGTAPPSREAARAALGLPPHETAALMFGVVRPYKGILEVIRRWHALPAKWHLWIVGPAEDSTYAHEVAAIARPLGAQVRLVFERTADETLLQWIAAADATLFNYRHCLTSGACCLARSAGSKIVLPTRLDTIDLREPCSTVFRFDAVERDLAAVLERAAAAPPDPTATAIWRTETAWRTIAARMNEIYANVAR